MLCKILCIHLRFCVKGATPLNEVSATQTDFRDTWLKFHRKFYVEYTEKNLFMYSIMKTNWFFFYFYPTIFPPVITLCTVLILLLPHEIDFLFIVSTRSKCMTAFNDSVSDLSKKCKKK